MQKRGSGVELQAVVGVIGMDGAMSARDLDKKRKKKKKRKLWRDEKVLEAIAGFRDFRWC